MSDINVMRDWVIARDFDTAMVEITHDNARKNCVTKRMKKKAIRSWSRYVHMRRCSTGTMITYACGCVDYFVNSIHVHTDWCGVCKHPFY